LDHIRLVGRRRDHGRSDATLNCEGVRLGTSEFYSVVEKIPEVSDSLVVHLGDAAAGRGDLLLFVVLSSGPKLEDSLRSKIVRELRKTLSPSRTGHLYGVPAVPRTVSGNKLEVPVTPILTGLQPTRPPTAALWPIPKPLTSVSSSPPSGN
jgi:acetoacetyl-CoA synthetase